METESARGLELVDEAVGNLVAQTRVQLLLLLLPSWLSLCLALGC